ncbi:MULTISPECIES: ribonuclease P protein component [unclassified Uliginosibacterium]|uniref:ribonuclease P protein component n=1 Tax=unclassified Uliginosibacterium TaxID=2621521 RepID=UPI0020B11318|nr:MULTISPECIES: ribonuclease P protein component [unclassified Uliginosibacterium]MDO6386609.1 ribonuclease P protein component [Uliginosibacterium sp. 31-12]
MLVAGSELHLAPAGSVQPQTGARSFRPAYRLCKTDEYSSVFAFRKAVRGRYFVLHYRPSESPTARLGVVVAKKLARRAVLRNLIKRMAREWFRHTRETLPRHDLILRLNAPALGVTRADLRQDLAALFKRLPK